MTERQFNTNIKIVRSDNTLELESDVSRSEFFSSHGILHQTMCPHTPQQNGIVERKHKHLLETCRALLFQSYLPIRYWGECLLTTTYLINRFLSEILSFKTPYEILFGNFPSYTHLKSFGCLCFVSTHPNNRNKLQPRAEICIFISYPFGKGGYKVLNLKAKQISISRNVIFHEHIYPFAPQKHDNFIFSPTTPDSTTDQSIPISHQVPISPASPSAKSHVSSRSPAITTIPNSSSSSPGYISQPLIPDSTPENMFPVDSLRDDSSLIQELRRSQRIHKLPTHLNDYILNAICHTNVTDDCFNSTVSVPTISFSALSATN